MYCRICGNEENVTLRTGRRGLLCDSCAADTPAKVSREAFDAAYWDKGDEVHHATRREFYDDYRASNITLAEYIRTTQSAAM